jgi:hypothetical protein
MVGAALTDRMLNGPGRLDAAHAQDAQTKLWTITAPKHQLEARGVIDDAEWVQP